MSQLFGNIPEEVLYLEVRDWDDDNKTLKQAICECTDQDVISAKFVVSTDEFGNPYLASFCAWTEDYVLTLIYGAFGYCLIKNDRNP